jgi:tetratricopeptide (TPR) repeat protein
MAALNLTASNADSLIAQANKFYSEGLYNDAVADYEQVLDEGLESWELLYNLGNTYFKLDDMASSIYYYEKALKLEPDNEDLIFNLKIANNKIADKIEALPEFFLIKWWKALSSSLSINNWTIITIVFFALFLFAGVFFFTSRSSGIKRLSFWTGLLVFVFFVLSFVISSKTYQQRLSQSEAIVFSQTVTIKSSPIKNSVDLFVIHEGAKVTITDEVDDWYEIRIANGSVGWLPANAVKRF